MKHKLRLNCCSIWTLPSIVSPLTFSQSSTSFLQHSLSLVFVFVYTLDSFRELLLLILNAWSLTLTQATFSPCPPQPLNKNIKIIWKRWNMVENMRFWSKDLSLSLDYIIYALCGLRVFLTSLDLIASFVKWRP